MPSQANNSDPKAYAQPIVDQRLTNRRRIYLIRHSEVSYIDEKGAPQSPKHVNLTARGKAMARDLAEEFRDIPIDRVVTSELSRTLETAQIILSGHLSIAFEQDKNFNEIQSGKLSEFPLDQQIKDFLNGLDNLDDRTHSEDCFSDAENFSEFQKRVHNSFINQVTKPDWKQMIIVGHEVTNRALLGALMGGGTQMMKYIEQDMAGVNIIDVDISAGQIDRLTIRLINGSARNLLRKNIWATSFEAIFAPLIDWYYNKNKEAS